MRAWQGHGLFDLTVMDAGMAGAGGDQGLHLPRPRGRWDAWALNLLGPVVLTGAVLARQRAGRRPRRPSAACWPGACCWSPASSASLPLIERGVALAVQLQTSRVFWPVELLATLYVVWWLAEAPAAAARPLDGAGRGRGAGRGQRRPRASTSASSSTRSGRVLAVNLPADDWTTALRWVADHTPPDAFVLADPGHAWKFGTAVRIGARRDVYLEETKDVAMAMYSPATAARVLQPDRPRRRLRRASTRPPAASWPAARA